MNSANSHSPSVLGGSLLIAGCCIGAGMLGLPVLSASAGFIPSVVTFILCWLFMVSTGFLLLEVNLSFGSEASIITMAKKTLGKCGETLSWILFVFLFYCIMVAYSAASGTLVTDFLNETFGLSLKAGSGSLLFSLIFGILLFKGMATVDWFNRVLMVGLILAYSILVAFGLPHVDTAFLSHTEWSNMTLVIPAAIISFGFHNLIPSLNSYFKGDIKALKRSIWIGSLIPLVIYLFWEGLILGIVPVNHFKKALEQGEIATEALKNVAGISWILDVAQVFAFFAIVTSFLTVAVSFVDFLSDGLLVKKTSKGKLILIFLVLLPPTVCSIIYPTIFLSALSFAGGVGTVILFGILPALMVWKGRYGKNKTLTPILPGGRYSLILVILFSVWVMSLQMFS